MGLMENHVFIHKWDSSESDSINFALQAFKYLSIEVSLVVIIKLKFHRFF